MREILFKAKRVNNGEWVEGYYLRDQNHIVGKDIIFYRKDSDRFTVYTDRIDIETLCQFTGLCDKNGKRIWENDIVFVTDENDCSGQISTGIGDVIFIEGMWYIDGRPQEGLYDINKVFQIEVIGNAFDNQELLQEESDE